MTTAFCVECKKYVQVLYEPTYDENGVVYEFPVCSECSICIVHCYDCKLCQLDSENTPIGQTYGTCLGLPKKRRISPTSLICSHFKEASS